MTGLLLAAEVIGGLVVVLVALALGYLVWKRSLLEVQSKAMEVQAEAIAAYEHRIKQLEEARAVDADEIQALKAEIAELRGELKGQRDLAQAIIETIADTRVCLLSPDCPNRVIPS